MTLFDLVQCWEFDTSRQQVSRNEQLRANSRNEASPKAEEPVIVDFGVTQVSSEVVIGLPDSVSVILSGNFGGLFRIFLATSPREGIGKQLAILHTSEVAVYELYWHEEGRHVEMRRVFATTLGGQQSALCAVNMCHGRFGGTQIDQICVQSLGGEWTFLNEGGKLFSVCHSGTLLCGPLAYSTNTDSIVASNGVIDIVSFKYHTLQAAGRSQAHIGVTESAPSQLRGKPLKAPTLCHEDERTKFEAEERKHQSRRLDASSIESVWGFQVGADVLQLSTYRNDRILCLTPHTLYEVQADTGHLMFQLRFDFIATCFAVVGEDNQFLVSTDENQLKLFHSERLIWACHCKVGSTIVDILKTGRLFREDSCTGWIVTLTAAGKLRAGCFGTKSLDASAREADKIDLPPYSKATIAEYKQLLKQIQTIESGSCLVSERNAESIIFKLTASFHDDSNETQAGNTEALVMRIERQYDGTGRRLSLARHRRSIVHARCRFTLTLSDSGPTADRCSFQNVSVTLQLPHGIEASESQFKFAELPLNQGVQFDATFFVKSDSFIASSFLQVATSLTQIQAGTQKTVCFNEQVALPSKLYICSSETGDSSVQGKSPSVVFGLFPKPSSVPSVARRLGIRDETQVPLVCTLFTSASEFATVCAQLEHDRLSLYSSSDKALCTAVAALEATKTLFYVPDAPVRSLSLCVGELLQLGKNIFECEQQLENLSTSFRYIQQRLLTRYRDKASDSLNHFDELLQENVNELHEKIRLREQLSSQFHRKAKDTRTIASLVALVAEHASVKTQKASQSYVSMRDLLELESTFSEEWDRLWPGRVLCSLVHALRHEWSTPATRKRTRALAQLHAGGANDVLRENPELFDEILQLSVAQLAS
ncbi:MAG: hypothetical protein MHM6MM_006867, partial [Cercozoa sp. M6MM]